MNRYSIEKLAVKLKGGVGTCGTVYFGAILQAKRRKNEEERENPSFSA